MKESKKEARRREQLAALFGMDTPPPSETAPLSIDHQNSSREAEAVIAYLERPSVFVERSCKNCSKDFLVNRGNVTLCSDACRATYLLREYGIEWDWNKQPNERYYYRIPGIETQWDYPDTPKGRQERLERSMLEEARAIASEPLSVSPDTLRVLKERELVITSQVTENRSVSISNVNAFVNDDDINESGDDFDAFLSGFG